MTKGPCTRSLKFSYAFFGGGGFVFIILSYQTACYRCKNAENRTSSEYFLWQTKVSEAVCKCDWPNMRSYLFYNVQKFVWKFWTPCAITLRTQDSISIEIRIQFYLTIDDLLKYYEIHFWASQCDKRPALFYWSLSYRSSIQSFTIVSAI